MKAIAVFPQDKKLDLIDVPEPDGLGPTEVRVRVLEVGVCGTDREICAFDYGTPPSGLERLVIGHEALGEVIETGRDVARVRSGDLVVPTVRRPCPHDHCTACGESRQDFCFTGDFVERGIKMADGYMTEYLVDDERYMNVLPPELRDVGVLVEPLTIAEKALAQIWQVQQRLPWACPVVPGKKAGHCHTAVVLGAGPVGLLGAMALATANFDVAVYSREPSGGEKAKLVGSFGARYVAAAETPIAALPDLLGPIDVVYEAAGASSIAFEMMGALGTNGIFVFTGVPGRRGPIQVDADVLMRRLVLNNQVVFGTVNAGRESFEAAVRDLGELSRRWPTALRSLITARHPIASYREQLLARSTGIKNVLSFA